MAKHVIRIFVDNPLTPDLQILLDTGQAKYLHTVMRKKVNDEIILFNGVDGEYSAQIISIDKRNTVVAIKSQVRVQTEEPGITLFFAPVKNVTPGYIVQKATELGVERIVPVITDRTIIRSVKEDKLRANAIEAAEQCERLTVPLVLPATALKNIFLTGVDKLYFACEAQRDDNLLSQCKPEKKSQEIGILIGPEGGFTESEISWLQAQEKVVSCSLGSRILKADTAAIAAISVLML